MRTDLAAGTLGLVATRPSIDAKQPIISFEKGNPVARPVSKAGDLTQISLLPKRSDIGSRPGVSLNHFEEDHSMRPWTAVPRGMRFASAIASVGVLAIVGACADSSTSPALNAPDSPAFVPGVAVAKTIEVCISSTSPAGTYSIDLSSTSGTVAGDIVTDPVSLVKGVGAICGIGFFRAGGDLTLVQTTLTASTAASGTFSYTCVDDVAVGDPLCVSGTAGVNGAVVQASGQHGTTTTFNFVAAPLGTPLFVIGDDEPHGIGATVNFWGAQWWKNNFMTGVVSNGVASFKGYATEANNFCGGVWATRPGNSSNPPATIPDKVLVIVTPTVLKDGPDITGTIKKILVVEHDGGYGPAPGKEGNGIVRQIACQ